MERSKQSGAQKGVGSGLSGAIMIEVGRSCWECFFAFLELVLDVLSFTAKTTTKKEDVGSYFSVLGSKIWETSRELEEVAKKSETGGDKSDSSKNSIREVVNVAKGILDALKVYVSP